MVKRPIEVEILGQRFSVRGDYDEDYVQQVARFVDEKMHEATQGRPGATLSTALLAAMNIAEELFSMRERLEKKEGKIKRVQEGVRSVIGLIEGKAV